FVVIIIKAAFADRDHARVVRPLDQCRGAEVGMRIGLVRMDSDARPDIRLALGDGDDVAPFALPRGDVEEAGNAALPGVLKHFGLALDQTFVIEVAVAVDQPHAASSSSSSSRGKSGVGCAIGVPPLPESISVRSLSADAGMIGAIACVSWRTATTSVPSTAAIRSGSVLRSAHGAWVSTWALQANTARSQASMPTENAKRSNASGTSSFAASRTSASSASSSLAFPGSGRTPSRFL